MVIQGMAWTPRESKFDLQQDQEFFFFGGGGGGGGGGHSIRTVCGTHPSCRSLRTGLLVVVGQRPFRCVKPAAAQCLVVSRLKTP